MRWVVESRTCLIWNKWRNKIWYLARAVGDSTRVRGHSARYDKAKKSNPVCVCV